MREQILTKLREELKRAEEKEELAGREKSVDGFFTKRFYEAQATTNTWLLAIELVQGIKE